MSDFNIEEFRCVHCGQVAIKYTGEQDLDDTGSYYIAVCENCERDYHEYEDGEVWARNDKGTFDKVKLTHKKF